MTRVTVADGDHPCYLSRIGPDGGGDNIVVTPRDGDQGSVYLTSEYGGEALDTEGLVTALTGLLGPLLIVGMGLFVMAIVFAMLLPIFAMNSLIH